MPGVRMGAGPPTGQYYVSLLGQRGATPDGWHWGVLEGRVPETVQIKGPLVPGQRVQFKRLTGNTAPQWAIFRSRKTMPQHGGGGMPGPGMVGFDAYSMHPGVRVVVPPVPTMPNPSRSQFIPLARGKRLRSVVVYPGVGYGTQEFVRSRLGENVIPRMGGEEVLLVIAPSHSTPWAEVKADIEAYSNRTGIAVEPGALVGWSGGAHGVQGAVDSGTAPPSVLLADPSPVAGSIRAPGTRAWYQPANWGGKYAHLGPRLASLMKGLGQRAKLVALGHDDILDMVTEKAIREQGSQNLQRRALQIGLPVAGSLLALLLLMKWKSGRS